MTQPSAPALYRPGGDVGAFVSTWIKIWAAVLAVVTLVAVIYLVAITQTLASINGNLDTARDAVVDVGGETKTLPRQVDNVNNSLKDIDDDVRPIHANTVRIRTALQSIQGKLVNVNSSLINTSSVLSGVQSGAGDIRGSLVAAQSLGSEGTNLIWRQVGEANVVLMPVERDARTAVGQLERTNNALARICAATAPLTPPCSR